MHSLLSLIPIAYITKNSREFFFFVQFLLYLQCFSSWFFVPIQSMSQYRSVCSFLSINSNIVIKITVSSRRFSLSRERARMHNIDIFTSISCHVDWLIDKLERMEKRKRAIVLTNEYIIFDFLLFFFFFFFSALLAISSVLQTNQSIFSFSSVLFLANTTTPLSSKDNRFFMFRLLYRRMHTYTFVLFFSSTVCSHRCRWWPRLDWYWICVN